MQLSLFQLVAIASVVVTVNAKPRARASYEQTEQAGIATFNGQSTDYRFYGNNEFVTTKDADGVSAAGHASGDISVQQGTGRASGAIYGSGDLANNGDAYIQGSTQGRVSSGDANSITAYGMAGGSASGNVIDGRLYKVDGTYSGCVILPGETTPICGKGSIDTGNNDHGHGGGETSVSPPVKTQVPQPSGTPSIDNNNRNKATNDKSGATHVGVSALSVVAVVAALLF